MSNKNNNSSIYVFSTVDTTPTFKDNGRKGYIPYGEDNLYPKFLQELMNNSALHGGILKKTASMIAGGGFVPNDTLESFILNEFGRETLEEISYKIAYDLAYSNIFTYQVTWSQDGKSIARITYVPAADVRLLGLVTEKANPDMFAKQEEGIEFFQISPDWANTRKEINKPEVMMGFSEKYAKESPDQLVRVMSYRPGSQFYTLPDYVGAIDEIENDVEIARFDLNNTKNSFAPSFLMTMMGNPTEEEKDARNRSLKKQMAGAAGAGKVIITDSEDSTQAPILTPIESNGSPKRFTELKTSIASKIVMAHGCNNTVSGIAEAGKLNSSAEVDEQYQQYQATVIQAKQALIEKSLNKMIKINGIDAKIKFVDVTVKEEVKETPTDNNDLITE